MSLAQLPGTVLTIAAYTAPTILLYRLAQTAHRRHPGVWNLPVLLTATTSGACILVMHLDLERYALGTAPLAWMLGPATVALAVPLFRERALLRRRGWVVVLAVLLGALSAMTSAVMLARAFGLGTVLTRSMVPKSVTTPVAMPIAERLGGNPEITAVVVILTGVFGMAFGPWLLRRIGVRGPVARGLSFGAAAHGVGTAAALGESERTGAASALAMVLAALLVALLAPWLGPLLVTLGAR